MGVLCVCVCVRVVLLCVWGGILHSYPPLPLSLFHPTIPTHTPCTYFQFVVGAVEGFSLADGIDRLDFDPKGPFDSLVWVQSVLRQ